MKKYKIGLKLKNLVVNDRNDLMYFSQISRYNFLNSSNIPIYTYLSIYYYCQYESN